MRLTREEALKRARGLWDEIQNSYLYHQRGVESVADLLLAVQSETVEKCCEIAELTASECGSSKGSTACACISNRIRAAFPGEEAK